MHETGLVGRALRLKEPLSVCTDRFCRIGRAKLHNTAGISAYTTHQHNRPRFHTAWVIFYRLTMSARLPFYSRKPTTAR